MAATTIEDIAHAYHAVRAQTLDIVAPLEIEDFVVQTAPFMSPPRWHMGHTSWFFEMLLKEFLPGYRVYDEDYLYYFNSYYDRFGVRIDKDQRGTRSRPTVKETLRYRTIIDESMLHLFEIMESLSGSEKLRCLVRLGIEHEMQHQELLVYDIKHLLCDLYKPGHSESSRPTVNVQGMAEIPGGLFRIGHGGQDFAFDNEKPTHPVYVQDFAIDRAPVSVGEYLQFMRDGGYSDYRWWFSEGWMTVQNERWEAPLYWEKVDGDWMIRGYTGLHRAEDCENEPVSHVSFYEASACAKWAGKRLPTEAEWERTACYDSESGEAKAFPWGNKPADSETANLLENRPWEVAPIGSYPAGQNPYACHQMIGDVWEWTSSDYVPYPGFVPDFDEYNDKWMVGQKVLRGGSYATPRSHIRSTYRNFFHPQERWMVSGFRCARTL
ncbi:MAG TPA: ergothioneine biosynthesis protein EgtB [Acidobacteriota bacterium]|nr:ergothioneine biosynthesis protein EgtB [Acidobacteriota bacterium]